MCKKKSLSSVLTLCAVLEHRVVGTMVSDWLLPGEHPQPSDQSVRPLSCATGWTVHPLGQDKNL